MKWRLRSKISVVAAAALAVLSLTGSAVVAPAAAAETIGNSSPSTAMSVQEIIVGYEGDASSITSSGSKGDIPCISADNRQLLNLGRKLGGGMQVIRIEPAVSVATAYELADQLSRCPSIAWAEPDTVRFLPATDVYW